ncbi:unnamed protein product [Trichobilharzia szidati]|nr:unnamed protein product [Trichobilharzia szidati]
MEDSDIDETFTRDGNCACEQSALSALPHLHPEMSHLSLCFFPVNDCITDIYDYKRKAIEHFEKLWRDEEICITYLDTTDCNLSSNASMLTSRRNSDSLTVVF